MRSFRQLPGVLSLALLLAACGGGAAPASPSAAPSTAASPAASAKPAASAAASAKPAASTAASGKPAASGAASAKPVASGSAAAKPAASGSAAASAAPSLAPAVPGQIVVAYSEVVSSNVGLWGAKEGGYFDKNGLNVDPRLIESSLVIGALLSGQVPIGAAGGSEAFSAAVEGADIKILGTTTPIYPYKFEVSKDIQAIADIKGKKVGISRVGSSSDIATHAGFKKVGLDADKDVQLVQVGSLAARTAAIVSGAIQGAMANPPDTLTLEDQGFHPLIDLSQLGLPASNNGINVSNQWLMGHKAEAQKYVDSIVQAIAREKKDKAFTEMVLQKYLKIDDKRLIDAAYDFWVPAMPSLPYPKEEQFTDTRDIIATKNPNAKTYDLSKLLDPSFIQSAADRGLDKS